MRSLLLAAVVAFTAAPALAQADLKSQFGAANAAFLGGALSSEDYLMTTRTTLIEGIEGVWFPIWYFGADATQESYALACEKNPINIAIRDEFSFTLEQVFDGGNANTTTIFTARGGNVFGSYTEPQSILKRLGLDEKTPPTILTNVLSNVNGVATLARPSPDIVVIQTNYNVPQIYGRCPA